MTLHATQAKAKFASNNSSQQRAVWVAVLLMAATLFSGMSQALTLEQKAPDFTLKSLSGENLNLTEQRGNIIVINFWASWCGPCRTEMPILQDFHDQYQDLGVAVWGVNVEQENQAGIDYIRELAVDFPIFFDASNEVSANYNVEAMPTTVIIDRNGKVRSVFRGYQKGYEKKYAKVIKQLIRE
ncbi:MAG: TlpA family protein disulfide reductase [Cognaticolwellia sp.]